MNDAEPYFLLSLYDMYTGSQKSSFNSTVGGALIDHWFKRYDFST